MNSILVMLGAINVTLLGAIAAQVTGVDPTQTQPAPNIISSHGQAPTRATDPPRLDGAPVMGRLLVPEASAVSKGDTAPTSLSSVTVPKLIGVLSSNASSTFGAIVLQQGQPPILRRLRLGERLEGWRLVEVRRTEADLEDASGKRTTLSLAGRPQVR